MQHQQLRNQQTQHTEPQNTKQQHERMRTRQSQHKTMQHDVLQSEQQSGTITCKSKSLDDRDRNLFIPSNRTCDEKRPLPACDYIEKNDQKTCLENHPKTSKPITYEYQSKTSNDSNKNKTILFPGPNWKKIREPMESEECIFFKIKSQSYIINYIKITCMNGISTYFRLQQARNEEEFRYPHIDRKNQINSTYFVLKPGKRYSFLYTVYSEIVLPSHLNWTLFKNLADGSLLYVIVSVK